MLAGCLPGIPQFNRREEKRSPLKEVENEVLLRAFAAYYNNFKEECKSNDGNSLNAFSMHVVVGLACDAFILLKDAILWFYYHPKH